MLLLNVIINYFEYIFEKYNTNIYYMMNRIYVRQNITTISIAIFIFIFALLNYFKPGFLYKKDGSLREFGLGYKNKTVIPLWFLTIIIAIVSYLFVLYYLVYPRL